MPDFTSSDIKILMIKTVRPVLLFATPGTVLESGKEYDAVSNRNGAISGICENGEQLGVKPYEFKFVSAPRWILGLYGIF